MKKFNFVYGLLLCVILSSCYATQQSTTNTSVKMYQEPLSMGENYVTSCSETTFSESIEQLTYIQAYTDFLLNSDIDPNDHFPIGGYYLIDLNYDNIPELGVLHDSMGSMGGYFNFYHFNGDSIVPIQSRYSNYTQILGDSKNKRVFFLKEMYLIQGNDNGTYGYVGEMMEQEDGTPYMHRILELEIDQNRVSEAPENRHLDEDDFLSDVMFDEILITQGFFDYEWEDISSNDYLKLKRKLIPVENDYVDLRDTNAYYLASTDEMIDVMDGKLKKINIDYNDINILFSKWLEEN
jgi:hypothetical protein